MKIIGKTGNDFIVQASRQELCMLGGCDMYNTPRITGAVQHPTQPDYWKEGIEINIIDAYNLIYKYQTHHANLEAAASQLETVAKAIAEDLRKKLYPITKDGKVVTVTKAEVVTKGKKAKRMIDTQGQLEFIT